ncbi:DUF2318 domain-containing protein [Bifidobacterium tsurumiense]|uniref:Membrane protein, PF10080 family n=1 Tax=Bifidobacterium tsurumiense TaxID=356829 RepID=A0A087ECR7_9BIFI|nr:DUF2318 domain-containing protein [Bifidobacterium tsurumiense]KFJ05568.1 membrane protein, PF10080 family [Bifidobacterium tsurumiense]
MLKQFVTVLSGTLPMMLVVMCLGTMFTVGEGKSKPISAKWRSWGLLVGIVAAVVFATLRATAVITQRTSVNLPALMATVVADIAVIVLLVRAQSITSRWQEHPRHIHVANGVAAVAIALTTFFALPDVILQLTAFVEPGESPFTSEMLLRALGFLLGLASSIILAAIVRTLHVSAVRPFFHIAAVASMVLMFLQHLVALLQVMQGSVLRIRGAAFRMLVWGINHHDVLVQVQMWVFIIPAVASIVAGMRMKVRVSNIAERRRNIAFRRRAISCAIWSVAAMLGVTMALTVGVAQTKKVPVLSEPEAYSLEDGVATIPFSQLEDGHLHRFEYKASDGTVMRFIIIKKNGGAYGVGLDACENCGDAGYYEKDGKIICKKCDVAINLATIGFKGGCNPIPLPYTSDANAITIQTADLDALSAHFT